MKCSLLVAVYKRADFLEKILSSLIHQSRPPLEVIICEDGQDSKIAKLVEEYSAHLGCPLIHITQEDKGNRKTLCVNKGIAKASGEYLVTIDGDCVLHPYFLQAHLELADEKCFLTGRRVELSEKASSFLSAERIFSGYLQRAPFFLWGDAIFGKTRHLGRFFRTPKILRNLLKQNDIHDIRGCNFSVHKKHLLAVNGYNNDFSGAYGEDSDLELRLLRLGLKRKSVKGAAIQYHLWHKEQQHDPKNQEKLLELKANNKIQAENGIKELSTQK